MYKKYVKKRGRLIGPYYYESIRQKNGKIRAFYLGKDPDSQKFKDNVALLKLKGIVKKGDSFIIPIEMDVERPKRPFKINPNYLALKYFFGEKIAKVRSNISKLTPNFRMPKLPFSFNSIKLPKVALLKTQDALPKGESIVTPIEPLRPRRPFKIKYELAALKELFSGVEKVTLPKIELAKEYAPEPGQNDFDFHAALFVLLAVVFVFGFFYLEATITTYSVTDIIHSRVNYLPTLISIANIVLLLLIYFNLRRTKI